MGGEGGGAGNYAYKNCLYFSSFHAQVSGYELNIAPVMFSEHVIFVYLTIQIFYVSPNLLHKCHPLSVLKLNRAQVTGRNNGL